MPVQSTNARRWFNAVDNHEATIETDRLIAAVLVQQPDRIWSRYDVFHALHQERELGTLRDAIDELVAYCHLQELAVVDCDEHEDCEDPLCGDALFRIWL